MISVLIATSDNTAGGIERALGDQLALLGEDNALDITILCPPSAFHKACAETGRHLISLGAARRLAFRHLPALAKLGIEVKFDLALCHNGFMARGLSRFAKHVIGICHNDKPRHFKGCDHLVCLTADGIAKAKIAGWPEERLSLIPHYHKTAQGRDIPMPAAPLHIGAAGRMVGKKNLALFIEIARIVKQTHPEISFELAGTGPLKDALADLNKAKNNPVTLSGWVAFSDFLDRLDVMVIPSTDEPFGYIFPEAMAEAVAILSTPTCGANHNLVKGAVAPIIAPEDAAAFAAEICRLNDDLPALHCLQKRCYQRVLEDDYTPERARQSWMALIKQLAH